MFLGVDYVHKNCNWPSDFICATLINSQVHAFYIIVPTFDQSSSAPPPPMSLLLQSYDEP